MKPAPVIAISSCILGNRVRYDGELKQFPELCAQLQQHFQLLPVCPEVEIGLSVPRPPLQLTGDPQRPRMTGRDDPGIDVSDGMYAFCSKRPAELRDICGYVFKSRSPSCGLRQLPVFRDGNPIEDNRRGLFAEAMIGCYPDLPVVEETDLQTARQLEDFINQVFNYCRRRPMNKM